VLLAWAGLINRKGIFVGSDMHSTMFEVVIIERGPTHWEWQVCKNAGVQIMQGREKTRAEARYQGNRALFSLLASGWKPMTHPKSP
jgi:hypothetical protein